MLNNSLSLAKKINNLSLQAKILGQLGNIYLDLKEYNKAKKYQEESLIIAKQLSESDTESNALLSLGLIFDGIGNDNEAIDMLLLALEIANVKGIKMTETIVLYHLANLNYESQQYRQAQIYCHQALNMATKLKLSISSKCQDLLAKINHSQE